MLGNWSGPNQGAGGSVGASLSQRYSQALRRGPEPTPWSLPPQPSGVSGNPLAVCPANDGPGGAAHYCTTNRILCRPSLPSPASSTMLIMVLLGMAIPTRSPAARRSSMTQRQAADACT